MERIADRLEDVTTAGDDCLVKELIVALQCLPHGIGILLPAIGRTLNIGQQEDLHS